MKIQEIIIPETITEERVILEIITLETIIPEIETLETEILATGTCLPIIMAALIQKSQQLCCSTNHQTGLIVSG